MHSGRGPAQTASILQLILGGLTLLAGTCIGTLLWAQGINVFLSEMQQRGMKMPDVPGESVADVLRLFFVLFTAVSMLIGTLLLVLAIFVRRGKRPAIIASIILVGLVSLILSMDVIGGIVQMNPFVIVLAGVLLLGLATIRKLIQSLQSGPDPQAAAAMQQAWMWMMQQQQQQSAGGYGYGYGPQQAYPPPPTPLPAPEPPKPDQT